MKKNIIIKCPKCGQEYLMEEIYYPQEFFGYPLNIIRDEKGKIIYYSNESINPVETYTCDNCDCKFEVTAKITFDTKICDSDNEFTMSLYDDVIELNEEEDNTQEVSNLKLW